MKRTIRVLAAGIVLPALLLGADAARCRLGKGLYEDRLAIARSRVPPRALRPALCCRPATLLRPANWPPSTNSIASFWKNSPLPRHARTKTP